MTLTLPENPRDLMDWRNLATNIADSFVGAFWVEDRIGNAALDHLKNAHDNFAALAEALGYDLSRKAAPAAAVAS